MEKAKALDRLCMCGLVRDFACGKCNVSSLISVFSSPEPKAHGELIVYRSIRRLCVRASVRPCVRP